MAQPGKVRLLKFPLSSASDLFLTNNSTNAVSLVEVQTAPAGITICKGGCGEGEGTRWHPYLEVINVKTQKGGETLQGYAKGMGIRISCNYLVMTICNAPCWSTPV